MLSSEEEEEEEEYQGRADSGEQRQVYTKTSEVSAALVQLNTANV